MRVVEWSDPWPGLDRDGNEITVAVTHRVSVEGAILMQRAYHKSMGREPMYHGDRLLDEFVIIHWATIKEVEPDGCSGD